MLNTDILLNGQPIGASIPTSPNYQGAAFGTAFTLSTRPEVDEWLDSPETQVAQMRSATRNRIA